MPLFSSSSDRFRDGAESARRALDLGPDDTSGALSSPGALLEPAQTVGRNPQSSPSPVIQAEDALTAFPREVLAQVVDVVHYAGRIFAHTRRRTSTYGHIGARTSHLRSAWYCRRAVVPRRLGEDAPEWLWRLADAGKEAPAEFARFVAERVEALLWWRSLIERQLEALAQERPGEGAPEGMDEAQRKLARVMPVPKRSGLRSVPRSPSATPNRTSTRATKRAVSRSSQGAGGRRT